MTSIKNQYILPNEIYQTIFGYLSMFERINIIKISKHFRFLINVLNGFQCDLVLDHIYYTKVVHNEYCPKNKSNLLRFFDLCDNYGQRPYCDHTICYPDICKQSGKQQSISILCRLSKIIIGKGYFRIYDQFDNSYNVFNSQNIQSIYLKCGDQVYIHCKDQSPELFSEKQRILPNHYPVFITISKLHIIFTTNNSCRISYKSHKTLLERLHKSKFSRTQKWNYNKRIYPCQEELGIIYPTMAACDSNENVYILDSNGIIHVIDYQWNFARVIFLTIDHPHWISIKSDKLYVCNTKVIYIYDLYGRLIFKIDSIFRNLKCLAFDTKNNIVVVDDDRVLRICL